MTGTSTAIYPQTITNGLGQIVNADGQTLKTVYTTNNSNGTKLELCIATSTDTSSRDLQFSILNGANTYILGTITCPANSGNTAGTAVLNVLGNAVLTGLPKDSNGNPYIYLAQGSVLKVEALTTVTSGKTISIITHAGDF